MNWTISANRWNWSRGKVYRYNTTFNVARLINNRRAFDLRLLEAYVSIRPLPMRFIRLKIIVAIALTLCAVPFACGSEVQDADKFAFGGIGAAGIMSQGEAALRTILAEPDAVTRLEKMLPHATDAGRLYILVGLRIRDRSSYKRAFDSYSKHDSTVETVHGCMISRKSFQSLMQEIDRGDFDGLLKQPSR